jgi:Zn-dependent protease
MKGSLHLATVTGIPVKIHWSFGLMLLWVAYETSQVGNGAMFVLISIGIVLSVFFCVILHEFGHALAARKFGVQTFDIMMTPIGGIARLERMPEGRGQEFWVAIAGPCVNFVIVGLIWLGFFLFRQENLPIFSMAFWDFENEASSYFKVIMLANGYLGTFNLLPAFPMDGGRMLRSLLSLKLDRTKATQIASYAGQGIALIMFGLGILRGQPTLTLIGVFIFFAARQEYQVLVRQTRMATLRVINIMEPLQHLLFTGQRMIEAREIVKDQKDSSFIVWSRPGIPAGYISRDRLLGNPPPLPDSYIDAWIIPSPAAVPPDLSAGQLYNLMQQHKLPIVLVFDQANYIGMVHWEKVQALTR